MSYNILTIPHFDRELNRLAKKYLSLRKEYEELVDTLEENPTQGSPLGHSCYKIRISIASKNKGKSGGGRVIINVLISEQKAYLLTIYDKGEMEDISEKELLVLLKQIPL